MTREFLTDVQVNTGDLKITRSTTTGRVSLDSNSTFGELFLSNLTTPNTASNLIGRISATAYDSTDVETSYADVRFFSDVVTDADEEGRIAIYLAKDGTSAARYQLHPDQFKVPDGTAATPSVTFAAAPTNGMYRHTGNSIAFSTNGTMAARVTGVGQWLFVNGSASAPSISFDSDLDVGLYYDTDGVHYTYGGVNQGLLSTLRKTTALIGNGTDTTFVITHNWNTKAVGVHLWRESDGIEVEATVTRAANTVTLDFGTAPTTNQYGYVIFG